jgi:hypothetical protein
MRRRKMKRGVGRQIAVRYADARVQRHLFGDDFRGERAARRMGAKNAGINMK